MTFLPNALTSFRLIAAPVVAAFLVTGHDLAATLLFIIAALTDLCDGYVAKIMNAESEFGAWLDAFADKVLAVCVFLSLGWLDQIPVWLVLLVVARDAMIMIGVWTLRLARRPIVIRPLQISRINTVVQFVFVAFVMGILGFDLDETLLGPVFELLRDVLCYVAALTTIGSWIVYAGQWSRMMLRAPQAS